jgi:hypothetical protein
MRRLFPLLVLALAFALLAAACGDGNDRPEVVGTVEGTVLDDPASLVLQERDIGSGYMLDPQGTRVVTNADASEGRGAAYRRELNDLGRVLGYQVVYVRDTGEEAPSGGQLQSSASTFRTVEGAHTAFLKGLGEVGGSLQQLERGVGVGHESRLYGRSSRSQGRDVQLYAVAWRRDRVLAVVLLAGLKGEITRDEALGLARKQDATIEKRLQ